MGEIPKNKFQNPVGPLVIHCLSYKSTIQPINHSTTRGDFEKREARIEMSSFPDGGNSKKQIPKSSMPAWLFIPFFQSTTQPFNYTGRFRETGGENRDAFFPHGGNSKNKFKNPVGSLVIHSFFPVNYSINQPFNYTGKIPNS
jgi:hypothetical protein